MTPTVPGLHAVKPSRAVRRERRERRELLIDLSDDPTEYPDGEVICREVVEGNIARNLQPLIERYQAWRGVVCYTGSDNFIYYCKGDNTACVSPDFYTLPGVPPNARPRQIPGSKDEGGWKTWLLGVAPNFTMEVKAFKNPRKDELQSPKRHDALGTEELIIFDPFAHRPGRSRKRFCLMRRNEYGNLVTLLETNDDRIYSQELDAYVVAQGEDDESLLRLGLGPNGERLLLFNSEIVDIVSRREKHEARLQQGAVQLGDEQARLRQEQALRADEQALRADYEARMAQRADEQQALRADEAMCIAEEAARRTAELEAEVARLRADTNQRPKRVAKGNKSPQK